MYIGTLDSIHSNSKALLDSLIFLQSTNFKIMSDGEYKIGVDGIFARVSRYKTRPADEIFPENHTKMIDVQYVAEGEEFLGWCPFSPDLEIAVQYDESKDATFYKKLVPDSNIILSPGLFAVLYPSDVHRAGCSVDGNSHDVLKVVIKIPIELVD